MRAEAIIVTQRTDAEQSVKQAVKVRSRMNATNDLASVDLDSLYQNAQRTGEDFLVLGHGPDGAPSVVALDKVRQYNKNGAHRATLFAACEPTTNPSGRLVRASDGEHVVLGVQVGSVTARDGAAATVYANVAIITPDADGPVIVPLAQVGGTDERPAMSSGRYAQFTDAHGETWSVAIRAHVNGSGTSDIYAQVDQEGRKHELRTIAAVDAMVAPASKLDKEVAKLTM